MNTDRELLESAAKAAGLCVIRSRLDDPMWRDLLIDDRPAFPQTYGWNPLKDDGDALRLAVRLRLDILMDSPDIQAASVEVIANHGAEVSPFAIETLDGGDPYEATRRAIVRAAAALART